ncbi:hypothetical protein ABPG74_013352 [Tetrahymena malaccensis]
MLNHLLALLVKNFYLWKRDIKGTLCEILVPLIFALFVYIFMAQSDAYEVKQTSYLNQAVTLTPSWDPSLISNSIYSTIKNCSDPYRGGQIGIAPNIPITQKLSQILTNYPGIKVKFFDSTSQFNDHITSEGYPVPNSPQICFGILFDSWQNGIYKYTLAYNQTDIQDIPQTYRTDYVDFEQNDKFMQYINSGFTRIVNWIDNLILQLESGNPNLQIVPNIAIMETETFQKSNLYSIAGNFMNVFIVIPMIVPFLRLSSRILNEKEKRIREGMMMVGLGKTAFYSSWILTYLIVYIIISILVSIVLKAYFFTVADFGVILILHFSYAICNMAQSLFITVFFDKQRTGIIAATFLFLIQFLLSSNQGDELTTNNASYQGQAAIAANAINQAMRLLVVYQSRNESVSIDMMHQLCNRSKLIYSINSSWINFALFFILFLYFDQVIPNEFGQRKHLLFFIGCNLVRKSLKKTQHNQLQEEQYIESIDISLKQQENSNKVKIIHQNKFFNHSFQQTIRIEGLSKQFKTDGVIKQAVNSINLQMYSGQVFSFLGHNGAGKSTTISMLTGMIPPSSGTAFIKGFDVRKDLEKIRKILGVCPQHDILFDQLTVKEHLYFFATLKGMPFKEISQAVDKIISDVDLVEKTNSLSCSLSGGQKRKLSVAIAFIGESEVVLLDEPTSGMDVQARRHIWEMIKNYKQQKVIILTTHFMDEADYLGDRIGIISDGQIKCVGSSVFLKEKFGNGYNLTFVKEQNTTPSEPIIQFVQNNFPDSNLISDYSAEIAFQVPYKYIPQFEQMFNQLEQQKDYLKIRSYGVSITTLEEVFLKVASMNENHIVQAKKIAQNQYIDIEKQSINCIDERITNPTKLFFIHFWALIQKRLNYFKRDKKGLCCELILPIILIAFGLLIQKVLNFSDSSGLDLTPTIFFDENPKIYYGGSPQYSAITNNLQQFSDTTYTPFNNIMSLQQFNDELFSVKTTEVKFGYYLDNNQGGVYTYTALINTVSLDGIPMSIHLLNNAIIKSLTGKPIQISVTNKALPKTYNTQQQQGLIQGISSVVFFSMGISFIPASIISFIVKERAEHIKHQQIVSGVTLKAYWISNFFIDYIKFLIPTILSSLLAFVFQVDTMTQNGNFGYFILLFIFYGLALMPFVYLFSFVHSDYGNAQIIQFFVHFMIGGIGAVIFMILSFSDSTHDIGVNLAWILRIFPSFAIYDGFSKLSSRKNIQIQENLSQLPSQMNLNVMGGDFMFLIISFFLFTAMLIYLESIRNKKSVFSNNLESKYPHIKPSYVDSDVEEEIKLVQNSNPKDFTVLVRNLRKVFPPTGGSYEEKPKIAVDNLNFGVQTGDVFCFLGVNGAGKTTTMRMLTGEETIGSGEAYIQGCKIPEQISQAQQYIGYCPQFDALLDNLTAREHLELFAAIKGIPANLREQAVNEKLDELNLRKFENVVSRTYSGGNKRKLSVAIAMLGNPPIAFLDEPSTGMDPGNRRFMWNVISDIATNQKKTSIILTTHSMEEAEALGTKVGIVVGGNFQCMGSIQHLKNKFGKGYEVSIKTNIPNLQQLQQIVGDMDVNTVITNQNLQQILNFIGQGQFIEQINEEGFASSIYFQLKSKKQNGVELYLLAESIYNYIIQQRIELFFEKNFDGYEILEGLNNYLKVRVQSKQHLGYLFGIMNRFYIDLNIASYTVCQTSLEQVFYDLTKSSGIKKKPSIVSEHKSSLNQKINQINENQTTKMINPQNQNIYSAQVDLQEQLLQQIELNQIKINQQKLNKKN